MGVISSYRVKYGQNYGYHNNNRGNEVPSNTEQQNAKCNNRPLTATTNNKKNKKQKAAQFRIADKM